MSKNTPLLSALDCLMNLPEPADLPPSSHVPVGVNEMQAMTHDEFVAHCDRFVSQAGRHVDWLDAQFIVSECIARLSTAAPTEGGGA